MRGLLDKIKNYVVYDADREFYARVFPNSVSRADLFRIRTMTHGYLPSVMEIENQNYEFPWAEDIFTDCFRASYHCHVCEEMDKILGYCILAIGAGEAHILNISVDPKEHKQGIGRKMLEFLIEKARGNAETIFLEVLPAIPSHSHCTKKSVSMKSASAKPENAAAQKQAYRECSRIVPLMLGDYYPMTQYSLQENVWVAWQFDRPDLGMGVVQAFRRAGSPGASKHFRLHGLQPGSRYEIEKIWMGIGELSPAGN